MIFKKIFIKFQGESSIKKVNFTDLFTQISIYSGRNKQIFAIYISTKYAYFKRYIDILNNIDLDTIRIKFLEESTPNSDTGFFLSLMLDDEPNNLRQTTYFNINKWNTDTAMTPIPSCRPALVYTDTVKKTTTAADGGEYMLSKCDSYFISPSLERIEEIYGDLVISSPFPLSIGTYKNNVTPPINYNLDIVWNSTSISNPTVQQMPPFLLTSDGVGNGPYTSYLTKFQDPTQLAKITLLIVISTNLTIIFKDKRKESADYEPFPMRPYQKIYILPGSPAANRQQVVFGNGDIVYFNKRIDHNIQLYFKKTNDSISGCTLSAMWGYYSNLFTEYRWVGSRNNYNITPINNKLLFDVGVPTYNNIYTLLDNVVEYKNGYSSGDVYVIVGYSMKVTILNDIPYITFFKDIESAIFITDLPFIRFTLESSIDTPIITNINTLFDKIWMTNDSELITKEYNISDKSMGLFNFNFDRTVSLETLKNYLLFGVFGSNTRILRDGPIKFKTPKAGRYIQDSLNIGWVYESKDDSYLCFGATTGGKPDNQFFFIVQNFRNYYGFRFKYTGAYTEYVDNVLYVQGSNLQGYYTRGFNLQVNQLFSLAEFAKECPTDDIVICLLFISRTGVTITDPARNDITNNLTCELIKEQPPYSEFGGKKTAISIPTSYLCSTIDAFNDSDYYNFKKIGLTNFLYEESYVPKIIRQDFEIVLDPPAYTFDATFKKDYYAIRIPNFFREFPLLGLDIYIIPFDKFELRYVVESKINTLTLPKGYSFTIENFTGYTFVSILDQQKSCVLYFNEQNSSYDIYVTLDFDKSNLTETYAYYKTVCASACIANCAGTQPLDIYSNIVSSYEEYGSLYNGSVIDSNRTKYKYINKNIHSFRVKMPIINIENIKSFDLENLTYGPNKRQLILDLLIEINYFS